MNPGSNNSLLDTFRKGGQNLWEKLKDQMRQAGLLSKPDIEINPLSDQPEDQRKQRQRTWLIIFLVIATIYLWQGFREVRQDEIPYSEFLKYVQQEQVEEAVVTEQMITGYMKPKAPGEQARRFITVPLWNQDLAKTLEEKGIKYSVRYGNNWLGNFIFNWLLPIGILFLLWTWMARRMTGAGR